MVNTRELILEILLEVIEKGSYSHLVIRSVLDKYQYLEKQERAFITRVCEGTIQTMIELDYIINQFSKVKVNKMKPVIRNILRMSVYQLRYMDSVPDSAACNEAVKLARKKGFSSLSGFVNGVLRNISRNPAVGLPNRERNPIQYYSVKYSMPEWIVELWMSDYGAEVLESILEAFAKEAPISVTYGLGKPELDTEGRCITLEYPGFYLVNCYTPNAQEGLKRLPHRMAWDEAYRAHLQMLDAKKPVIACADFNVAHEEIDLKNPGPNRGNAGFSDEERADFTRLLEAGFTDSFRYQHPDLTGAYSWWSYRFNARKNNAGWRIDYFLVSDRLREQIEDTAIWSDIYGSDHCPVVLELRAE